jgi:hypothetical protein
MLNRRRAKTGQMALVYFISDLDPSGLDLERAWSDALKSFGVSFELVRIGLTLEQVTEHDLGRLAIEVKPSDSRAKAFVAEYGDRCWEADVLPASAIEAAVGYHIDTWLDMRRWKARLAEIERARKLL